jgi:hypothetical protein
VRPKRALISMIVLLALASSASAAKYYRLRVYYGSGDGYYKKNTWVSISAEAAPSGKVFDRWDGTDTGRLSDRYSASTSYKMPKKYATLTATYKNANYTLTVNSGSGDGTYAVGSSISIAADVAPSGKVFDEWTGASVGGLADATSPNTTYTMGHANATVGATYVDIPTTPPPTPLPTGLQNEFTILAVGVVRGRSRTIIFEKIRNKTWAQYALWSDNNRNIYFKSGEVFDGAVHANSALYFSGNPVFHGRVTSGTSWYGGSIANCTFDQGFTRPVETESMADVDFPELKQKAALVLYGTTTVKLVGSNMKITNSREGWNNHTLAVPPNGLIFVDSASSGASSSRTGDLYIEGTLDGRLTFVTDRDINITDDITYVDDPKVNTSSDDALGLISNRDIVVKTSCPDDVKIYAHMIATGNATSTSSDGSFGVQSYNTGNPRGFLNVHGGIAQDYRGAVGTFSTSTGVTSHGFNKNYTYDRRFATDPPPEYPPLSNRLHSGLWRDR